MKGFPKVIKTRSDLVNTYKLVKRAVWKKKIGWQQLKNWKIRIG